MNSAYHSFLDRKQLSDTFTKLHKHLTSTIFLSVFSSSQEHTNPTIMMMPRNRHEFFFYLCFLGLAFLWPSYHLISLSSSWYWPSLYHIFTCPCVTNKSGTYCKDKGSSLTTFLGLKMIRDAVQYAWVTSTALIHRNKKKCCRLDEHYIVAHPLGLSLIREKFQRVWVVGDCLVAHFLCFKAVRDTC